MKHEETQSVRKRRALEAFLVSGARSGDAAATEKLVRLLQPRLLSHAHRLLDDADGARDVTQAAWIDILRGLPRLRDASAFHVYALRIVSRKVARVIRGKQRDRHLANDWAVTCVTEEPSLGERDADASAVRAAMARLKPAHSATLALFYLEGMTVSEVAASMDVPVGTVKTRLMHAREQLRHVLEVDNHDQTG
ncbi:MAG: RNA polymerase sigma factor [Pseudomonadota bacterium]